MTAYPILLNGTWQPSQGTQAFHGENPVTGEVLEGRFPVSSWQDLDVALSAAAEAAGLLRGVAAAERAKFLTRYAERIEGRAAELAKIAGEETGLVVPTRLMGAEIPRTAAQLRQGAAAAVDVTWSLPTIDTKNNIRSHHAPIGPVLILGPNNFPFAFNAISGGDFAAAIAAGCPVIAKGHPSHPNTTRLLAEDAVAALGETSLPKGMIQLIYHMSPDMGLRAAADGRLGAVAFTGSRRGGLALKAAADAVGKPSYLEMSSLNPVVMLPGALEERLEKIADEFADSALMANGQFCTNPGITILMAGEKTEAFIAAVKQRYEARAPSALFSSGVLQSLSTNLKRLVDAGATVVTGGAAVAGSTCVHANTLLRVNAERFMEHSESFQTETFGNVSLFVVTKNIGEVAAMLAEFEGNLTGCVYSSSNGKEEGDYAKVAGVLRRKVGRLLNDKMPTGVALSPAMNHGGPYPATGHPGFTSVGIPASLRRFTLLESYDNVRQERLPAILRDKSPGGEVFRMIDGKWREGDVG